MRLYTVHSTIKSMKTQASADSPYFYFNRSVGNVAENIGNDNHKIWYPIPKREIAVNENLVPNPGYGN